MADTPEHPTRDDRVIDPSVEVTRSEEELFVRTQSIEAGRVRVRKTIDEDVVDRTVLRDVEHAHVETVAVDGADSGEVETLSDGSISIPVFEEEVVVTTRLVVRERVIVRKHVVSRAEPVHATVRREHVEIEADPAVFDRIHVDPPADGT
jgi:uncharacterized protein (TIGR02271 family)